MDALFHRKYTPYTAKSQKPENPGCKSPTRANTTEKKNTKR
jgi:hypothetical protein